MRVKARLCLSVHDIVEVAICMHQSGHHKGCAAHMGIPYLKDAVQYLSNTIGCIMQGSQVAML